MSNGVDKLTPARVEQRKAYWHETGVWVASVFSELTQELHGPSEPIRFNGPSKYVDSLVTQYFQEIDLFKDNHSFPRGQKANESKRAALTVKVLRSADPGQLFIFPSNLVNSPYYQLIVPFYTYHLICGYLEVRGVDAKTEHLLMYCLKNNLPIADEWLFLTMAAFQRAHGA